MLLRLIALQLALLDAPPIPAPPDQPGYEPFDLSERRQHWAYQPVRATVPPTAQNADWPTSPIDRFILTKLEAAGLSPAAPADKRTLIRRVTFDLIGLPPTAEEVSAFVADESPDAFERVVERLLASPHYGERWARHWLDLVRFAETLGHELDFELFNAWRYRDYCLRVFNLDLPYDQFVIEHVAGDLLPEPRRHPTDRTNESIIGTGFWWLGEAKHSPVDVRQEQMERIDNQLDVFGKTFLAQTIACARCHDHKFDAISMKDYYALAGYLKSSRYQQAFIDPPDRFAAQAERLAAMRREARALASATVVAALELRGGFSEYLLAAIKGHASAPAAVAGLDPEKLERLIEALTQPELKSPQHPLYTWVQLAGGDADKRSFEGKRAALCRSLNELVQRARQAAESYILMDGFDAPTFDRWSVAGDAFALGTTRAGDVVLGNGSDKPIAGVLCGGMAHSGLLSNRLEGALRSETITIEKRYIHFRAAGLGSRINIVVDGFPVIRDPLYGRLAIELNDETLAWRTVDLDMWKGHRAYIEIIDSATPNLTKSLSPETAAGKPGDGYVVVDEIRCSDDAAPPPEPPNRMNLAVLGDPPVDSVEELAQRYAAACAHTVKRWAAGELRGGAEANDWVTLLNGLWQNRLLDGDVGQASSLPQNSQGRPAEGPDVILAATVASGGTAREQLARLLDRYRQLEATIPAPTLALATADGSGEDERVLLRGNYRTSGEVARRRFLEVIAGADQPAPRQGSGRLELARRMVDSANPLVARVMVNRIWQHHFGAGLVRTPDDFGRMGEPPTHPELLDYLAAEFVRSGWSIKAMHRLMLASSTYRMSSSSDAAADTTDPQNKLLHRMPVRRLEAEAIRDAILAVSGGLDRAMYGPGVLPHLTPFMEGRGRPALSGPLDGAGRRTLYINVRRNFLNPMLLAFDYPIPFSTIGRRSVSNVPAQALSLMNSPFVVEQSRRWAERILTRSDRSPTERVIDIYETAFARPPTSRELHDALTFLAEQSKRTGESAAEPRAWADLCHVLMNAKEFIFIN
jgi:hypothetical protein